MDFNNMLGGLISPKVGIALIKKKVKAQLKIKKIDTFCILYNANKKSLEFIVNGKVYQYEDSLLATQIDNYLSSKNKKIELPIKDSFINFIRVDDTGKLTVFYTAPDQKKRQFTKQI